MHTLPNLFQTGGPVMWPTLALPTIPFSSMASRSPASVCSGVWPLDSRRPPPPQNNPRFSFPETKKLLAAWESPFWPISRLSGSNA